MYHKVCAWGDTMWDRSLTNGCQTVSLPVYELLRYSQSELTAIWGLGSGRERNGQREAKVTKRQSLVRMQPLTWKKKRFLCNHISHVPVTLTLSTPWMRAQMETIVCKFGHNPAICLQEEAIFMPAPKCLYHVTFDLDLEHTLDAGSPGDLHVQVWSQSNHFCRSDFRKKFTDGQTERRRTLCHCISSWNYLTTDQ